MATVLNQTTEIRRGRWRHVSEKRRDILASVTPSEFSVLRQQAGLTLRDAAEALGYEIRQIYRWENSQSVPRASVIKALRACIPAKTGTKGPEPDFTFIDLFAGIGGIRRGFETIGGQCVFTCEWDRYCQTTYRANFPDDAHDIVSDIRKVVASEVPDHDVLLAGFPCQPFSIAGVSKKNALNRPHGFACDTQGTLFFDVERILEEKRPAAFVLENVKNLLNHDKGRTFAVIRQVLSDKLEYDIDFKVVNAKSWVPQHRERIFIVGIRRDLDVKFTFEGFVAPDPREGPKLKTILHPEDGSEKAEAPFTLGEGMVAAKYTLTEHLWKYLQAYAEKHRQRGNGFGFGLFGPGDVARTLSARYYKDGSEILISRGDDIPRRLTPRECARLMGFDAPGRSDFLIKVSDMQAYKQFGNSVAIPAVAAVASYLKPFLDRALARKKEKAGKQEANS
ncbi:DNA (cytosine-5-)-methyltransferase [Sphingomonas sp. MMS24-J45]|uniref:DNA (cytosine-5-)-methyltransferase n=1 Tax=Sphingomonas sp. MMS24-J45 TaxID=3238806 RepID=UPI00384CFA45